MEMTPQEIVGRYRRATNKSEQIKILSELNACSKEDIKKILEDQGVTVKTPGRKRSQQLKSQKLHRCNRMNALRQQYRKKRIRQTTRPNKTQRQQDAYQKLYCRRLAEKRY